MVATYRSDELHRRHPLRPLLAELERSPCARRLQLERFDRDELADQLADILGAAPAGEVVERMYGRSDGNPLFTEELLAAGLDGRGAAAAEPARGAAAAGRAAARPRASDRCGCSRSPAAPTTICSPTPPDIDGAALSAAMREAISAQIVVADDGGLYGFRHALLREVLYDDLLPGERAELHLSARARARAGGGGGPTGPGPRPGSPTTTTPPATSRGR